MIRVRYREAHPVDRMVNPVVIWARKHPSMEKPVSYAPFPTVPNDRRLTIKSWFLGVSRDLANDLRVLRLLQTEPQDCRLQSDSPMQVLAERVTYEGGVHTARVGISFSGIPRRLRCPTPTKHDALKSQFVTAKTIGTPALFHFPRPRRKFILITSTPPLTTDCSPLDAALPPASVPSVQERAPSSHPSTFATPLAPILHVTAADPPRCSNHPTWVCTNDAPIGAYVVCQAFRTAVLQCRRATSSTTVSVQRNGEKICLTVWYNRRWHSPPDSDGFESQQLIR
ncbi:hypothetical protein V8E52_000831 [Russula decolorans]